MHSFTSKQVRNLKRGVRSALAFGIVTSIAANVIHSLTQHHDQRWQVATSAGLAALAPIVLFISVEMVSRIPVHTKFLGRVRLAITLALAGFAGWISYWHMVDVARMLGENSGSQYIYPLIIDGMMLVATISLIEVGRLGQAVTTVEAAAEDEKASARKCKPGCTCKRHTRKAPAKRKRVVKAPAAAPTSPGYPPVSAPDPAELEQVTR
jgi:hypothetical protein